jgi:Fe-Mn family superoxide dismutase
MFELPKLPFAYDALEPTISEATVRLHHDKHHAGYFKALNTLLGDVGAPQPSLEDVVIASHSSKDRTLFNNAGQAWNHTFCWASMSAEPTKPSGDLAQVIASTFGELSMCKAAMVRSGVAQFGSGWLWLATDKLGALQISTTHDAQNLLSRKELTPLLVCDLWEHAYYLDHQNNRKAYLEQWFDKLANWSFAQAQYAAAQGDGKPWTHPAPVPASLSVA